MLSHLVCALSLVVFYILQTTIFSRTTLAAGSADLILIFLAAWSLQEKVRNSWLWAGIAGFLVSTISAMPYFAPLFGYLGIIGISKLLQRRVWRIPIIAMFIVTLLGSIFQNSLYLIVLQIQGTSITWGESLDTVIVPSILLNLIFALPMYAVVNGLVSRIFPMEAEE